MDPRRGLAPSWPWPDCSACPAPGAAQSFGKNKVQYRTFDWRFISSPHFEVYYYAGGDSLALRVLDLAEKANVKLTRDMGHVLSKKVPIILYISHNDFAQTNVTTEFLDEGTGGFTELLKNRVVLPFTGSYEDLRHVVVHELVHAFMFDMLYAGGLPCVRHGAERSSASRCGSPRAWPSSSRSAGSPNADMFMRDGTIAGYLPPLPYGGGYLVYKEGQAAMRFIDERYGPDRIRDMLREAQVPPELRPRVRDLDGHHGGQVRRGLPVVAQEEVLAQRGRPRRPGAVRPPAHGPPPRPLEHQHGGRGLAARRPRGLHLGPAAITRTSTSCRRSTGRSSSG